MKLFTVLIFLVSASLFTFFSKGCGGFKNRLEMELREHAEAKIGEARAATLGDVEVEVDHYQILISGKVANAEERAEVARIFEEESPAGRGQLVVDLEIGRVGPFVSDVTFVKHGMGVMDRAALEKALGDTVGGTFDGTTTKRLAAKLRALPGVDQVEISERQDGDERSLKAVVTPTAPPVGEVEVVSVGVDVVELDEGALKEMIGQKVGDPFDQKALSSVGAKMSERKEVVSAVISAEEIRNGASVKIVAKVTPVRRTPMVVSEVVLVSAGGEEIDAAALAAAGVNAGDVYSPELLKTTEKLITKSIRFAGAKVTAVETAEGYQLTIEATPARPRITKVDFEMPHGVDFDLKKMEAALAAEGVKAGAEVDESELDKIAEKLRELEGVEKAELKVVERGGAFQLAAKITPGRVIGPGTHAIAGIDFEVPEGNAFDAAAALEAAGIRPGAAVRHSDLAQIAKRLEGMDGVKRASVELREVGGVVRLVAKVEPEIAAPPAPKGREVAGVDIELPNGVDFDRKELDAALKAAGIVPGARVAQGDLADLAKELEELDGGNQVDLKFFETDGKTWLVAKVDPKVVADVVVAEPVPRNPELEKALGDINIYFWTDSVVISRRDKRKLEAAAKAIVDAGNATPISVTGFADSRGDLETNQKLSLRRAEAVCDFLVGLGVKREHLLPSGSGVPGKESLQEQRRVEVRPSR